MKKIETGVFIGKFLPLHLGHVNTILKCAKQCKNFFLILADSDSRSRALCREANLPAILPDERTVWLKEVFGKEKNIKIYRMNQGMLEALPDNLTSWKTELFKITNTPNITWFIDKNYLDISHKVFPEINFIGFDRTEINISASEIRKDIEAQKNYLPENVYNHIKILLKM